MSKQIEKPEKKIEKPEKQTLSDEELDGVAGGLVLEDPAPHGVDHPGTLQVGGSVAQPRDKLKRGSTGKLILDDTTNPS